jgi:hypothetical protein
MALCCLPHDVCCMLSALQSAGARGGVTAHVDV